MPLSSPTILGNRLPINLPEPQQVGSSSWTQVNASNSFTVGIDSTNKLYAWGFNANYQVGDGTTSNKSTPIQLSTESFTLVSAGFDHSVAITNDNRLYTWGNQPSIMTLTAVSSWTILSSSGNHNLAIRDDGTLWAWGLNNAGQLGDNTSINKSSPVQIGSGTWTDVSTGTSHSVAISNTGQLYLWGHNNVGQVGDSTTINKSSPVLITVGGSTSWSQISAGNSYSSAIDSNGKLFTWGLNAAHQLGDLTQINKSSPTQIAVGTSWTNVSSGFDHSTAIDSIGNLYVWGNFNSAFAPIPTTIHSWTVVSAGNNITSAIRSDSGLYAWGVNNLGTLGQNNTINRSSPVQITAGSNSFTQVSSNYSHLLAIDSLGKMFGVGDNLNGQLGDNSNIRRSSAVQIGNSSWSLVNTGVNSSYGIDANDKLYAWGLGNAGQIPTAVNTSIQWSEVASSESHNLAISSNGNLYAWGLGTGGQLGLGDAITRSSPTLVDSGSWVFVHAAATRSYAIRNDGRLYAWGQNTSGTLGDDTAVSKSSPTQILGSWVAVATGTTHTVGIKSDGSVWAWGTNLSGQLGINSVGAGTSSPVAVSMPIGVSATMVKAGSNQTLVLTTTNALYTWGTTNNGIGLGDTQNRSSPTQLGSNVWAFIAAKFNAGYGITTTGELYGWGINTAGDLGDGTAITKSSPVLVTSIGGLASNSYAKIYGTDGVSAPGAIAITKYGTLYALGSYLNVNRSIPTQVGTDSDWSKGTLGYGIASIIKNNGYLYQFGLVYNTNTVSGTSFPVLIGYDPRDVIGTNYSSPIQVGNQSWNQISAGTSFALGIDSNNKLFAWGLNNLNQLGDGTTISQFSPVQIGNNSWISVAAGLDHSLAVRSDNTLWAWGNGLAIGLVTEPQSWLAVNAGATHTLGIRDDGSLWAWGTGTVGQLGNLTAINRSSPVNIAAGSWSQIFAGNSFSLAIDNNNKLFAWGLNSLGQLGDSTSINKSSPTQISTSSFVFVSAGFDHAHAIDSTGKLYGWGQYTSGQTGVYDEIYSWSQLGYGIGLRTNNTLWTWGINTSGQIGDGTTIDKSSPVQIGSNDWSSITLTYTTSSIKGAIKTNGTLFMWGSNSQGQLGLGDTINRSSPTQISGSWNQISTQLLHTAARNSSNIIYTWGYNETGELGDGTTINKSSPVLLASPFNTTSWLSVSVGFSYTAALRSDNIIYTWGTGNSGRLGTGLTTNRSNPVTLGGAFATSSFVAISAGALHALALRTDYRLVAWGDASNAGQLGDNTTINKSTPVLVGTSSWTNVTANRLNNLGVTINGALWFWGADLGSGESGLNATLNRSAPTQIGALTNWSRPMIVSAIDNTGRLFVWGGDNTEILNTTVTTSSPIQVGGFLFPPIKYYSPSQVGNSSWTTVSAGSSYTVGIATNNLLYGWGVNTSGQLGDSTTISKSSPVQLGAFSWNAISAGFDHVLAVRSDTTLWTWGNSSAISLVVQPFSWSQVSNGTSHTLAIRSDGSLFAWGLGTFGQLGNNAAISTSSPVQVGTSSWNSVSGGFNISLGIDSNNKLYTWGSGGSGQLGTNSVISRSTPTQIGYFVNDTSTYNVIISNTGIIPDANVIPFSTAVSGYISSAQHFITQNLPVFEMGTGNFTIEAWIYVSFPSPTSSFYTLASQYVSATTGIGNWALELNWPDRSLDFFYDGNTFITTPGQLINDNTWYHIAVVRNGSGSNNLAFYVNGINVVSGTYTGIFGTALRSVYIGRQELTLGGGWTNGGYISNLRIVKGVAVYTGNFTVPTTPLTATQSSGTNISAITSGQTSLLLLTNSASVSNPNYNVISASDNNGFAITTDNKLFGWGQNDSGQLLPYGSYFLLGYSTFSIGSGITAAIRSSNGVLLTWGNNNTGQLGQGDTINRSNPTQVGTNSWKQVSAASSVVMAIRSDDTLWTWGLNTSGQLGDGTIVNKSSPVQVAGSWSKISAGTTTSAGIRTDGTLWLWGVGVNGELGDGSNVTKSSPVQVSGGGSWNNVSVGNSFVLGTTTANIAYAWGLNTSGQLGDGTTVNKNVPTLLASPFNTTSFSQVAAGLSHSLGLTTTGLLYSWGGGSLGELGIGVVNRSNPTQVTGLPLLNTSYTLVYAGGQVSGAINENNLYVWGINTGGILGTGDTISRSFPTQIGIGYSWTNIGFDNINTLGSGYLRSDNSLWLSGNNTSGNLGNNTTINRSSSVIVGPLALSFPVQIGTSSWTAISAGSSFSIGINSSGQLYAWGVNKANQIGNNSTVDVNDNFYQIAGSWTKVAAGTNHSLAIKSDSTLWTWGTFSAVLLSNVTPTSWTTIAAGGSASHCAAIKSDGSLWTWGLNTNGQLGDSTTVNKSSPTQIGLGSWSQVAVDLSNTIAIRTGGNLFVWGGNASGQLGDGTTINKSSPVQLDANSWSQISVNTSHTTAIRSNLLFTWGNNASGQLGDGTTINRSSPVQVAGSWNNISAGSQYTVATNDLSLLFTWGNNSAFQLGDNTTINKSTPVQIAVGNSFSNVTAGPTHAVAIDTTNKLWTWGQQTSIGIDVNSWIQVAVGNQFGVAIRSDNKLFAWGVNSSGQLGLNDTINRSSPVLVSTGSWTNIAVAIAGNFSSGITSDGKLFTWGQNTSGQLGINNTASRSSPVQILSGSSFTLVAAGPATLYATTIGPQFALFVVGNGGSGALGDGSTINKSNPVQITNPSISWTFINAGQGFNGGIDNLGKLYMWGANAGYLGLGDTINRSIPTIIPGATSWLAVSAGGTNTLAIDSTNKLWAWGWSNGGQLGDGTTINKSSPVQIGTSSWVAVAANDSACMAIRADNTLWAWGVNSVGQLGIGLTTNRSSPVQVLGAAQWSSIACSGNNTMAAIATDNSRKNKLFLWGFNNSGQLATGDTVNRSSPTLLFATAGAVIPTQILNYQSFNQVSAGVSYTLAKRSNDNVLMAWGLNTVGNYGDNTLTQPTLSNPVIVGQNNQIDNSINSFVPNTINGAPKVVDFSPFANNPYNTVTYGGSMQFSGNLDHISYATNAAFTFGTGNFTVEFWLYGPNQLNSFLVDFRNGANASYPMITTGVSIAALRYVGSTGTLTGTVIIADNIWHHIAVTRESGTVKIWIDGILDGTIADASNYSITSSAFFGVSSFLSPAFRLSGYLSNVRIVKGQALYTTTFTPSTTPLTTTSQNATESNVSLLIFQGFPTAYSNTVSAIGQTSAFIDSTNQVYITGLGTSGQQGDGTAVSKSNPVQLGSVFTGLNTGTNVPIKVNDTLYSGISAGASFSVALSVDNILYAWGLNTSGQFGLNLATNRSAPIQIGAANQTFVDNSTFNYTLIYTGSTQMVELSPFASGSYDVSIYGASQLFNGSPDFLELPFSTAGTTLQFGTGDFTIECWFNSLNVSGTTKRILHYGQYNLEYGVTIDTYNNTVRFLVMNELSSGQSFIGTAQAITSNTWYHVAIVKRSGVFYSYLNGTQVGTNSNYASTLFDSTLGFRVGAGNATGSTNAAYYYNGYISNVRVVKGVGVYTGNFTVPTLPLSSTQSSGVNISAITGTQTTLLTSKTIDTLNLPVYSKFDAGGAHTSVIDENNALLYNWGLNTAGQLGIGDAVSRSSPVLLGNGQMINTYTNSPVQVTPGTSGYTQVFAGQSFSVAKRSDNSYFVWGLNASGQLGLNTATSRSSPTSFGTSSFTSVSAGYTHLMFVDATNNYLEGTGLGTNGQLGIGNVISRSSPTIVGNGQVINTGGFSPIQVSFGLTNSWTSVYAGQSFSMAKDIVGSVYVWGVNESGQLDNGSTINRSSPQIVGGTLISILDVSGQNNTISRVGTNFSTTIIPTAGAVSGYFNGTTDYIRCDNALSIFTTNTDVFTIEGYVYPVDTPPGPIANVYFLGINTTAAGNNTLVVGPKDWARNGGTGTALSTVFPDNTWTHFAITYDGTTFRLFNGGTVIFSSATGLTDALSVNVLLFGTEADAAGGTGLGNYFTGYLSSIRITKQALYTGTFTPPTDILTNSTVGTSGANVAGSLTGTVTLLTYTTLAATIVGGNPSYYDKIAAGLTHVVSTYSDNTLYTWGLGTNGQLGDNTAVSKSSPTLIGGTFNTNTTSPILAASASWAATSAGTSHSLAIKDDGTLWAWGLNASGQLGQLDVINRSSIVQIGSGFSTTFTDTSENAFAITSYGSTYMSVINPFNTQINVSLYGGSGYFNGTNTWVEIDNKPKLNLGTNDFTIELWIYANDLRTFQGLVGDKLYGSTGGWTLYLNNEKVALWRTGSDIAKGGTINLNQWHYIAWTRSSNVHRAFVDGILVATGTDSTNFIDDSILVGKNNTDYYYKGYISNLRIVTGSALYTANFTPPSTVLTAVSGTQLLTASYLDEVFVYQSISAGNSNSMAIKGDNILFAWGLATAGVLGTGNAINRSAPLQVGASSWSQVSTGLSTTLGIDSDGNLYAWGLNTTGQLGASVVTPNRSSPTIVQGVNYETKSPTLVDGNYNDVSAGLSHTAAISSGTLYVWGLNSSGQLGLSDTVNRSSPTVAGSVFTLTDSSVNAYSLTLSGGSKIETTVVPFVDTSYSVSFNLNVTGGQKGTADQIRFTTLGTTQIANYTNYTIEFWMYRTGFANNDSYLFTIGVGGSATYGRLFIDTSDNSIKYSKGTGVWGWSPGDIVSSGPNITETNVWRHVALVKEGNAASIFYNGTRVAYDATSSFSTYGSTNFYIGSYFNDYNDDGAYFKGYISNFRMSSTNLYSGTTYTIPSSTFTATADTQLLTVASLPNITVYEQLFAGSGTTFGITDTNNLYAWGLGTTGQIGGFQQVINRSSPNQIGNNYINVSPSSPVQIAAGSWSKVAAGNSVSAAIRSDGLLFTWGSNTSTGALGTGNTIARSSPVQIGNSSWTQISVYFDHMAALTSTNGMYVWGRNVSGQLGDNTTVDKLSPVQVGNSSWISIGAGAALTVGITSDNTLFAWGLGTSGQLGYGTAANRSSPVQIGTSSWTVVVAGNSHASAIRSDGAIFNWGLGTSGQLGQAYATISRSSPVQLGNDYPTGNVYVPTKIDGELLANSWTIVSSGASYTSAIKNNNTLWAWGLNNIGQLGDNTTINKSSPVQVGTATYNDVSSGNSFTLGIAKNYPTSN